MRARGETGLHLSAQAIAGANCPLVEPNIDTGGHQPLGQRLGELGMIFRSMREVDARYIIARCCIHGLYRTCVQTDALFKFTRKGRRPARAQVQLRLARAAHEHFRMLPGFRVNDGGHRGMNVLLKLLHALINRLALEVLEKRLGRDAVSAAAKFKHRR